MTKKGVVDARGAEKRMGCNRGGREDTELVRVSTRERD